MSKRRRMPSSESSADEEPSGNNGDKETSPSEKVLKTNQHYRWRPWEKEAFITAFNTVYSKKWIGKGPPKEDICEEIAKALPKSSGLHAGDVKKFLAGNLFKIRRQRSVSYTPIEKWLEVIDALSPEEEDLEKQLSLVMMVAKQEPLDSTGNPPSFDAKLPQPDYGEIYEYFSCAFANKPLPALSPIDSLVVEDCMQSLMYQIECLNDEELRRSLRKIFLHVVQDPEHEQEQDHEDIKKNLIQNATAFNPLGLNTQAIVPVVPE